MRKSIVIAVAVALVLVLGAGAVWANSSQPASKATAKVGEIAVIEYEDTWTTILTQDIKAPNGKDLFIDVSLQCGLYTETNVKSKGGNKDTSNAEGTITVRVLVDGTPAEPGEVVFSRRYQELSATLQGIITNIIPDGNDGYMVDEETLEYEEIELILDTMDAHAFNFVAPDLTFSGVHTIVVQAMIETATSTQEGTASATATIGKGSVTIELVRMIKGEDIELTAEP